MVDPLKLQGYIEAIAGKEIPLSPFDPLDRLPLYLCGYSFLAGEFDGVPYLFACVEKQELTPTQYLNQWEKLQNVLSAKVIFVFETLPAIKRNRFFQLHIPFIVPDSQFYLPPGINFSERQKRQVAIGEFLSYPAQLLVIREILFHDGPVAQVANLDARIAVCHRLVKFHQAKFAVYDINIVFIIYIHPSAPRLFP